MPNPFINHTAPPVNTDYSPAVILSEPQKEHYLNPERPNLDSKYKIYAGSEEEKEWIDQLFFPLKPAPEKKPEIAAAPTELYQLGILRRDIITRAPDISS